MRPIPRPNTAAIGFAESVAITHGGDGIKVSVICPQYVATPMLGYADKGASSDLPGVITPEALAQTVVQGVVQESFLILPHADVAQFINSSLPTTTNGWARCENCAAKL
jgi:NAD(P)-dependent dehydrogenase (short-subunit alcohol dehydrogenase family)